MSHPTRRLAAAIAIAVASAAAQSASAQGSVAPAGNAVTGTVRVTAQVPAILLMQGLHVTDVREGKTLAEVQSHLTVRGNVAYELSVRANVAAPAHSRIEVRGMDGSWQPLPASVPVIVASGTAGESPVDVQCRVSGGAASARVGACALTYEVASLQRSFALRTQAVLALAASPTDSAPGTMVLARAGY